MASITIRNISEDIYEKVKKLSSLEKRSLNSEFLVIIEQGTRSTIERIQGSPKNISRTIQVRMWENLSGIWEDERTTQELIDDIYSERTSGRDFDL